MDEATAEKLNPIKPDGKDHQPGHAALIRGSPPGRALQIIAAGADIAADVRGIGVQLLAVAGTGSSAARIAMMAMTTSNSIKVKPRRVA
jgi:hypothetical protein